MSVLENSQVKQYVHSENGKKLLRYVSDQPMTDQESTNKFLSFQRELNSCGWEFVTVTVTRDGVEGTIQASHKQ